MAESDTTEQLTLWGFLGGTSGKDPPVTTGDTRHKDSIPGLGRSPGEGNGNPFQYSCLRNYMDRGAWQAIVHRVTQSQTQLKGLSMHMLNINLLELTNASLVYTNTGIITRNFLGH